MPFPASGDGARHEPDAHTDEDKLFTYAIERTDLGMERGKLAAQTAHACRISLLKFLKRHPARIDEFIDLNSCGSVVVLKAKGLAQIERARAQAEELGLPTALFVDRDHVIPGTAFDGSPVPTVLAIGPATRESMRSITKKFRCA